MLKKRTLIIYATIVLMLIVGMIDTINQVLAAKIESPQMIQACQNALSSDRPGYTFYKCDNTEIYNPLGYVKTESSLLSVNVYFDDRINTLWCDMQQIGLKWVVTGTASTIAWPCL